MLRTVSVIWTIGSFSVCASVGPTRRLRAWSQNMSNAVARRFAASSA